MPVAINALQASEEAADRGGGLYVHGGSVGVQDSVFTGLRSSEGGAVAVGAGAVTVANSRFVQNGARRGGAAHLTGGKMSLEECSMEGNEATEAGALAASLPRAPLQAVATPTRLRCTPFPPSRRVHIDGDTYDPQD